MKIPKQLLQAEFLSPEKGEARIINMKWYTGATVRRITWAGETYYLTLSMKPEHVRMERLQSGKAPLLDTHSDYSLKDIIGVVESANLNGDARVRFSNREDVTPIWNDIQDGIIKNASVGTVIYKLKDVTEKDSEGNEKTKSYLATDWEGLEISLCPIGADMNAGLTEQIEFSEAEIVSNSNNGANPARMEEVQMEKETPTNAGEETRCNEHIMKEAIEKERASLIEAGKAAERARVQSINETVKALNLRQGQAFADEHIRKGTNIEVFRKMAIDKKANDEAIRLAEEPRNIVQTPVDDPGLQEESDSRRFAMTGALLERFEPGAWAVNERDRNFKYNKTRGQQIYDGSRHYIGMSLLDVAKECLSNAGIRWQIKSKTEIVRLAFQSTSDFPYILANTANKTLRAGYEMADSQWRLIAARRTAADFKTMYELTLDGKSRLSKIPESGEFSRGALIEGRESYALSTYGEIIAITRQAIINDDLGAFTRVPMLLGQEVAMLEADTVIGIITTNGNLADGQALFEEATYHKNYTSSGAAIAVDSIGALRVKMALQTSTGGKTLGLVPTYLLAPATKGQLAEQYCSTNYQAAESAKINPWAGRLTPIVEARLDATSTTVWYLFADPNTPNGTVLVYAYLEGQEGPYTETRQGFDVDGVEVKIRQDFAAAAVDYRGACKQAGA
jgi:phage major head subunit gpT-like protein